MRQAWWFGVLLSASVTASGSAQMGQQQQTMGANQSIMAAILAPVTGEPYRAEKVSRSVQTLSDGTVITHETRGMIARDGEGRMREDLYVVHSGQTNGKQTDMALQEATVGDPVAHTMLVWTGADSKLAMQMSLPSMPSPHPISLVPEPPRPVGPPSRVAPVNLATAGAAKDETRTEELGKQSLEGLLVTGKRTITTIPLGRVGNDRPIEVMHEEWRSPELNILVKTVDRDPRTGEQTMVLESLVRTDPDAALFHAPAGYEVKDMAAMLKGMGDLGKIGAK
jgi:hypothetical protein